MGWQQMLGLAMVLVGAGIVILAMIRRGKSADLPAVGIESPEIFPVSPVDPFLPADPWRGAERLSPRQLSEVGATAGITELLGLIAEDKADFLADQASRLAVAGLPSGKSRERCVAAAHVMLNAARPGSMADETIRPEIERTLREDFGNEARLIWPTPGTPYDAEVHCTFPPVEDGRHANVAELLCCGFAVPGFVAPARVGVTFPHA